MHACKRGKTEHLRGIICFNSVSTMYVPQCPSYGEPSIKWKSQTVWIEDKPGCCCLFGSLCKARAGEVAKDGR